MANKVDVRIIKSKESLMASLVKLLSEKNLDELTISEICEEASVNRNTFYSHYTGVRELFDEMKGKYMESFLSTFKYSSSSENAIQKSFVELLDKMRSFGDLTKVVLSQTNSFVFLKTLLLLCIPSLNTITPKNDLVSGEELSAFILGGIENLIVTWVDKDFPESPKTLCKKIVSLLEMYISL